MGDKEFSESEYYLHTNGDVIYKPHGGVDASSDFVKKCWNVSIIGKSPNAFFSWLSELKYLGADEIRVRELANKNKLDKYIPYWEEIIFGEVNNG